MEYFTADSYKNAERVGEPFQVKGKLYTRVKILCSRCGGTGYVAPWGTCFKCSGSKYEFLDVRLYTKEEKTALDKAKDRRQENKAAEAYASSEAKKKMWFGANGFSIEGKTYCVIGNTYLIKDKLKNAGFKYSTLLNWHGAEQIDLPEEYKYVQIKFEDVYQWNDLTHTVAQTLNAAEFMKNIFNADKPLSTSDYYGEVGVRYKDIPALFVSARSFDGYYGKTNIYNFEVEGNIITWMTTSTLAIPLNSKVNLTFTVKRHEVYKDEKITQISRCNAEVINEEF
jgi:ribosomal protein L37E